MGRPMLQRRDWPTLFKASVNSWSQLLHQIFRLVELALYHAEQASHLQPADDAKVSSPSKSSVAKKLRKQKQKAKLKAKMNQCPVCEGSRVLLDDPCPLCCSGSEEEGELDDLPEVDELPSTTLSEVEEPPSTTLSDVEEIPAPQLMEDEADEDYEEYDDAEEPCDDDEDAELQEARRVAFMDLLRTWSSGWTLTRKLQSSARGNSISFERIMRSSLDDNSRSFRATVKNTFVHISQDCLVGVPSLARAHSSPSL